MKGNSADAWSWNIELGFVLAEIAGVEAELAVLLEYAEFCRIACGANEEGEVGS